MLEQASHGFCGHLLSEVSAQPSAKLRHHLCPVEWMQLEEQVRHRLCLVVLHHLLEEMGALECRLPWLCLSLFDLKGLLGGLLFRFKILFGHVPSAPGQTQYLDGSPDTARPVDGGFPPIKLYTLRGTG